MPKARINDIEIYYEEHGRGFPLLLIMGLKRNTLWWYRQIPELSKYYRVIAFDNRGAGRSSMPEMDYSIAMFADDAVGLLDFLGIERTYLLGISMGGYIAQEVAIGRPDLVGGMVLGCTSCGGHKAVPMSDETRAGYVANKGLGNEEILHKDMHIYFSDQFVVQRPELIEEFVQISLKHWQPPEAFARQFNACLEHDTTDRLDQIKAPTLIAAGDDDHLVPTENSRILKELMPHATLSLYPGKRHCFFIEDHEKFNSEVKAFLDSIRPF